MLKSRSRSETHQRSNDGPSVAHGHFWADIAATQLRIDHRII